MVLVFLMDCRGGSLLDIPDEEYVDDQAEHVDARSGEKDRSPGTEGHVVLKKT